MASFWAKFKDFIGVEPLEEYVDDEDLDLYRDEAREEPRNRPSSPNAAAAPAAEAGTQTQPPRRRVRNGNVIGMPNSLNAEVLVIEPRSFEEAPQIVEHLRSRKSVILNLTLMDSDQAQRSVDFVAGATYAIDGHQERVGEGIFLFTPNTVTISTEMPSQLRNATQGFSGAFRMTPEAQQQQRRAQG